MGSDKNYASSGRENLQQIFRKSKLEGSSEIAPVFSFAEIANLAACVRELEAKIFA
jgi:hypothetical protein